MAAAPQNSFKPIGTAVAGGVVWMSALRGSTSLLGIANTVVLARLLKPEDFGIVALATMVASGLKIATTWSFDTVLIQKQDARSVDYDTVWTLTFGFGAVVALLLWASSSPLATFFNEPRLADVLVAVALTSMIGALANVYTVNFRKHLQFQREFYFRISVRVLTLIVTVAAALVLRSYWALVLGVMASAIGTTFLSYIVVKDRPSLSLAARGSVISFSKWLFLGNFLYFIYARVAHFALGRFAGSTALGQYNIAEEVSSIPSASLVGPINQALMPGLSAISVDFDRFQRAFVMASGGLATVIAPFGIGIAAIAPVMVPVVLGNQWLDTIALVPMLAISAVLFGLQAPVATALYARGQPRIATLAGIGDVIVLIPLAVVLTLEDGAFGAAVALVIASAYALLARFFISIVVFGVAWKPFVGCLLRPLLAASAMYVVVRQALMWMDAVPAHWALILAILIGGCTYFIALPLLWFLAGRPQGGETFILDYIRTMTERFIRQRHIRMRDSKG